MQHRKQLDFSKWYKVELYHLAYYYNQAKLCWIGEKEPSEQTVYESYIPATTQPMRMMVFRRWRKCLKKLYLQYKDHPEWQRHWLDMMVFNSTRAFNKVTGHYWYRHRKFKETCQCYKCIANGTPPTPTK